MSGMKIVSLVTAALTAASTNAAWEEENGTGGSPGLDVDEVVLTTAYSWIPEGTINYF